MSIKDAVHLPGALGRYGGITKVVARVRCLKKVKLIGPLCRRGREGTNGSLMLMIEVYESEDYRRVYIIKERFEQFIT